MEPLTAFTFLAAAGLMVWGYLVGMKRKLSLVPGYRKNDIHNDRGYAIWIGYNLMGMGTLGGIDGLMQVLFPVTHTSMFLAWAVIIVPAITVRIFLGKKRYEAI